MEVLVVGIISFVAGAVVTWKGYTAKAVIKVETVVARVKAKVKR